jgi:cellulose biosynthesis protein BcsQ
MAHFTTFYSYKGGVGRTLALANVAWLLANHPFEPARVLVVDFDLGAPGLHRVFRMKGGKAALGVVDYVLHFLQTAEVPKVEEFIHKTAYSNIDILPSGKMDRHYQSRLEGINWKGLYESAHGYQLIESLKHAISSVQPDYDYVLIDSLTGYSDIGGICVRQLPDSLILLFRLNLQNLDGIKAVYRALKSPTGGKNVPILPVITPSWPFLDEAATRWIAKAQAVFPDEKLLEISFDSGLSFGERIISKSASKLSLTSKVLADYKLLTESIREQNAADPLNLWDSLQRPTDAVIDDEETEIYFRIIRKRPNTFQYWQYFPRVFYGTRRLKRGDAPLSKSLSKLIDFLNEECDKANKFALWGRAIIANVPSVAAPKVDPIEDLNKALRIDPNFWQARLHRAYLLGGENKSREAISDFAKCLKLPEVKGKQKMRIEISLASAHLRLLEPKRTLEIVETIVSHGQPDIDSYFLRGKALYLIGAYQQALEDINKYVSSEPWHDVAQLMPAQILAAMGRYEEAAKSLRSLARSNKRSIANFAEAYLAVDPKKTLSLLSQDSLEIEAPIRKVLELLARLFLGEDVTSVAQRLALAPEPQKSSVWDYFEVIAMIRAKERSLLLTPEAKSLAYKIVSSSFQVESKVFDNL